MSPRLPLLWIGLVLCNGLTTFATDWPTRLHDNHRSGTSVETLSFPMRLLWHYQAPTPPQPAWTESPAIHDYLHGWYNLKPRQNFDFCFDTAIADGRVYLGSSVTGEVQCLDLEDGQRLWRFFTDAPIRLAPTVDHGRVYVGSDDGKVYCLDARDGTLIWSEHPGPDDMIWGNEHMMSVWPVRSSVLVQDGWVYWAAGMFPEEKMFLCRRRAKDGTGGWTSELPLPPQGYLLATPEYLFVPSGKTYPMMFDLETGKFLNYIRQSGRDGGAWAVVAPNDALIFGPTVTGDSESHHWAEKGSIARIKSANRIISDGQAMYYNNDDFLVRVDLPQENEHWRTEASFPYAIIADTRNLYVGGDGAFAIFDKQRGREQWSQPVDGKVYGLAIADGSLLVSTDSGSIYCYRMSLPSLSLEDVTVTAQNQIQVQGELHVTDGKDCEVTLEYGTDPNASLQQLDLGPFTQPGPLEATLTHLDSQRLTYCRLCARNAEGEVRTDFTPVTTAALRVRAAVSHVQESSSKADFIITRPASVADCELRINYHLHGTAQAQADYRVTTDELRMAKGQTEIRLPITLQEDLTRESNETLTLTLDPGTYGLPSHSEATLTLVDNDDLPGTFAHRMAIDISGYQGTKTLTNVPVLIQLQEGLAGFHYRDVHFNDAHDLVFFDGKQEQRLACDIEQWNPEGTSRLWVSMPRLDAQHRRIEMAWGNPQCPIQNERVRAWAWPAYSHVWHFQETREPIADAICPAMIGTALGQMALGEPGLIDHGLNLDGIDDAVILNQSLDLGSGDNTLLVWVRVPIVGHQNLKSNQRVGIVLGNYNDNPNCNWELHGKGQMRAYWNGGQIDGLGQTDLRDNQWHALAWVRDTAAGKIRLYIDGRLDAQLDSSGSDVTFLTPHRIGADNRGSSTPHFHGSLDEMRISHRALSPAILQFMVENIKQGNGVLTFIPRP